MRAYRLLAILMLAPGAALGAAEAKATKPSAPAAQPAAASQAKSPAAPEAKPATAPEAKPATAPEAKAPAQPADEETGIDLSKAAATLEGEDQGTPDAAQPAPTPEAQAAAPAQPGAAPEKYTVQKGDTLWDLSGKFLNNPWYWPKVWSYNPEIANPHFIYPGNIVRFYPAGEEAPARVEAIAAAPAPEPPPEEEISGPREMDDLSRADMNKPQEIGEGDEVAVVGPYKIGYTAARGVRVRHDTFVTQHELEEAGVLHAAFAEKGILSLMDRAYVQFKEPGKVRKGETYVIFKTDRPVAHPANGEVFGYQSTYLGTAKVIAVDEKAATIEITQAFDVIERGALLGPWRDKIVKQVTPRPNGRNLQGQIVSAQEEVLTELGENHVVFLDKGRADGVEEGNTFDVVRSGDPSRESAELAMSRARQHGVSDDKLPAETIGRLLVIDAQQTASTALVVKSQRELLVGDLVVMKAAGSAPSAVR